MLFYLIKRPLHRQVCLLTSFLPDNLGKYLLTNFVYSMGNNTGSVLKLGELCDLRQDLT